MKYFNHLISFFIILILCSCNEKEIMIDFINCWEEVEYEGGIQFEGSNYTFCFLNETELTIETVKWTDIGGLNCGNSVEYIKGTYVLTSGTLEIEGVYTDLEFSMPDSNCEGNMDFQRSFKVKVISETEFILDQNNERPYLGIRLIKV